MRYELRVVPAVIPEALLATTPPIVQAIALAGSGPSSRPCRARAALARTTVVPGRMRARAPSSRTSMPAQWWRTSTRMSSPWAWPFRLVPAARKTTSRPLPCAYDRTAEMSSMSSGTTTTWGTKRYGLASEAYLTRSEIFHSTFSGPSRAVSSPRSASGVP